MEKAARTRRFVYSASLRVPLPARSVFTPIRRIGGSTGWYYANSLWYLRAVLDGLVGGVGRRRGRNNPESVAVGDAIDFWRVEAFEPDRFLRLRALMKLPGCAWLEFEVIPRQEGSIIRQTAIFLARGLPGQAYWYLLYPIHRVIFLGMLRRIARAAVAGVFSAKEMDLTAR